MEPDYRCTSCGQPCDRELLTVMKVSFNEMGMGGRVLKSRVAGWLCPKCVRENQYWLMEPFAPRRRRRSLG